MDYDDEKNIVKYDDRYDGDNYEDDYEDPYSDTYEDGYDDAYEAEDLENLGNLGYIDDFAGEEDEGYRSERTSSGTSSKITSRISSAISSKISSRLSSRSRQALMAEPNPVKTAAPASAQVPLILSRPAYSLAGEDLEFLYPKSKLKSVLRIGAMFAAVFAIVYLLNNSLSDTLTENLENSVSLQDPINQTNTEPTPAPLDLSKYDMSLPYIPDLVALFEEYPSAVTVADNLWSLPEKLRELAVKNNETMDFVADYLNNMNNVTLAGDIDISGELTAGEIPHFIQWDKRWGYSLYGTEIMGIDGCGPTALAMVASGLTGNTMYNPRFVADYSQENDFITSDNSTTWTLMSEGAKALGITPRVLPLDGNVITSALTNGEPIIASMAPGDFTTGGHFIVMTGVSDSGNIIIRDPNSNINTDTEWDLDRLMEQIKNLWAFTKAV